ncbi:MAG: hypothetical protein JXA30_19850 [Deltaproteobacteria bacterium]|nr:hypothetical protein [Deltaproteobacteria bacterium]
MIERDRYPDIEPGTKRAKNWVTGLSLYFLGMGIQAGYAIDPVIKQEIDDWPDPFTFLFSVINGPRMAIQKKDGLVRYLGQKAEVRADVEMCIKNPEFAFMLMVGQMSTQDAVAHNRQFVKGDLSQTLAVIRVMSRVQALLFPGFIAKNYINRVPSFSWLILRNRILLYGNCLLGAFQRN